MDYKLVMDYKARNWITRLVIAITSKYLVTRLVTRLVMLQCGEVPNSAQEF